MMKQLVYLLSISVLTLVACKQNEKANQSQATTETPAIETSEAVPKTNLDLHQHDENISLSAGKLYACPMEAEYVTSDPDTRCTKCEMEVKPIEEVKADYDVTEAEMYHCSMHPEFVTSDANDQCPICEMNVTKGE